MKIINQLIRLFLFFCTDSESKVNTITVDLTGSRILHRKPLPQAARTMSTSSQQHAELNQTVHDLYLALF